MSTNQKERPKAKHALCLTSQPFSVAAALRPIDPPALDCSNGRSKKKGGFIRRPLGASCFSLSVSAATAPHMPQALQSSP